MKRIRLPRELGGWARVKLTGRVDGRLLGQLGPMRAVKKVPGGAEMDLPVETIRRLHTSFRGRGLHLKILRRYGLVRLRIHARRSSALILMGMLMLIMVWGLTQTVMQVSVIGAKDENQRIAMLQTLRECGIKPGAWSLSLPKEESVQRILKTYEGLTYAGLRCSGIRAVLQVRQATPMPELFDPLLPCDIVAEAGGIVTGVTVTSGEALVCPGDTVKAGQVLIAGTAEHPHAGGMVTAHVWTQGNAQLPLSRTETVRTGNSETRLAVILFGKQCPQLEERFFEQEETERKVHPLLGGLFLPLSVVREEHRETRVQTKRANAALLKRSCAAKAQEKALFQLPNGARVVDKRTEYSIVNDGTLSASVTLESVMQIGEEKRKTT